MRAWKRRPTEVASLLNPAFGALLIHCAVEGFRKESNEAMPFALLPFILPLSLHAPTRNALPRTVRTKMHVWVQDNPEMKVLFARRARNLMPYAREGLLFAASQGILAFQAEGNIDVGAKKIQVSPFPKGSDAEASADAARLVGRWLARAGELRSIYVAWGVRP